MTTNKALHLLLLTFFFSVIIPALKPSSASAITGLPQHLRPLPRRFPPFRGAPPPPPPPPPSCFVPLLPMSACVFFLTNTSGVSAPTPACCDALESILADASDIICLCHVMDDDINDYTVVANPINVTLALLLPAACGAALPIRATHMCSLERVPPMNDESRLSAPPRIAGAVPNS
ncbi:hypothetical protein EJB05_48042 [Eragrostis curvula]|uniref:Bifunctional inhibitor/plant lipid transfer protein/seed storage helical domain-containing protein n=1 Tax=Eragrostis curvula TaxID=38414 RepID=A0A5J9T206_9POAL|nr:hypothetical protein EJB05_48042 [Eragrostis curvula]